MSYLEHEANLENCGCPSCDLLSEYYKKHEEYQKRKPYRVVEITGTDKKPGYSGGPADVAELALNQHQELGYEMTAVIPGHDGLNRLMVFRSVPPNPPSNTDVINKFARRKEETKNSGSSDFDFDKKFGPTIGGKQ